MPVIPRLDLQLRPRASSMVMSRPALDCGWYQRLRAGTDDSPAAAGWGWCGAGGDRALGV